MIIKKRINTKSLYAILSVAFLGIVGVTFAYYSTNNTFTNEFNAGEYKIKTEEVFESPTNWKPGDVTPKTINVKNEGTVDAAVKVCFREEWEDKDGNPLSLTDGNNRSIAIKNFNYLSKAYWKKDCNSNCYYYYKRLSPGETTENILDSVTFNSNASFQSNVDCTDNPTTHTKTCSSTIDGYSGGKYTLFIDIETVQYSAYQNVWGHVSVLNNEEECENLNVRNVLPTIDNGTVAYYIDSRILLKDSELAGYDMSEAKCRVIYMDSVSDANKYNSCIGVKYIDGTNHHDGETLLLKNINYRDVKEIEMNMGSYETNPDDGSIIFHGYKLVSGELDFVFYSKLTSASFFFPFDEEDVETMNFTSIDVNDWESDGSIKLHLNSEFTMPNHAVIFLITRGYK